jgi:hypothetical protein
VDFIDGASKRTTTMYPSGTATIQDLEREFVGKDSAQDSEFEFLLVDGQVERNVPRDAIVRNLPLHSVRLTVRKHHQAKRRVRFFVPQRKPDALTFDLRVGPTVGDARQQVADFLGNVPGKSIVLLSAGRVLRDPFVLANLDSDIVVRVSEWRDPLVMTVRSLRSNPISPPASTQQDRTTAGPIGVEGS